MYIIFRSEDIGLGRLSGR